MLKREGLAVGIGIILALLGVIVAIVQLKQSQQASGNQDSAQSTQIALLNEQLLVQREIATLQAGASGSSSNATVVAERVAELQSTAIALSTQQSKLDARLMFEDNFEDGKAAQWINENDGEWSLWQDNGNWVYGVHDQPADIIQTVFLDGSEDWQNYSFETEAMFKSGRLEQIWLSARTGKNNPCSGYIFGGNRYGIALFRYDQKSTCTSKTLAEASNYRLYENRLYKIRLDIVGNQIRGYIDDELILSAEDSIYPRGGIALSAYEVAWAFFDNIRVYQFER